MIHSEETTKKCKIYHYLRIFGVLQANEVVELMNLPVYFIMNGCPTCLEPSMPFRHHVWLMLFSPNTFTIFANASITLFMRFAQNFVHIYYSILGSIAKLPHTTYTTSNKRT